MTHARQLHFVRVFLLIVAVLVLCSQAISHFWISPNDFDIWLDDAAAASPVTGPTTPLSAGVETAVRLRAEWTNDIIVTEAGGLKAQYFDWESFPEEPYGYRVYYYMEELEDYEDVTDTFSSYYEVTFDNATAQQPWVTLKFLEPGMWSVEFVAQVGIVGNNNVRYASASPPVYVDVTVVPPVKVYVDAENIKGFGLPNETAQVDAIKDVGGDPTKPGKVIFVNSKDAVNDGAGNRIPDFADGYNLDGVAVSGDEHNSAEQFVPLTILIGPGIDPETAFLRFDYSASRPLKDPISETPGVQVLGDYPLKKYTPAEGHLRLWNVDGSTARNGYSKADETSPGNWIEPCGVAPGIYRVADLPWNGEYRRVTLYVEGIGKSAAPGDVRVEVAIGQDWGGPGTGLVPIGYDGARFTVLQANILADTNQDGEITSADELGKDIFCKDAGAIVLNNCDNDRGVEGYWEERHDNVNNYNGTIPGDPAPDEADLTKINVSGLLLLPPNWKVTIETNDASNLRVFGVSGRDGDRETIIGPDFGNSRDVTEFALVDIDYAAEALAYPSKDFSGLVDVTLKVWDGTPGPEGPILMGTDTICLKVAPYLMLGHENSVEKVYASDRSEEFYKTPYDYDGLFRAIIDGGLYPNDLILYSDDDYLHDQWPQDAFDIGYSKAPGTEMHVAASLPRANLPPYYGRPLWTYAEGELLDVGVGQFYTPDAIGYPHDEIPPEAQDLTGDYGGNIEIVPTNMVSQGMIFMGDKHLQRYNESPLYPDLPDFLALQGIQGLNDDGTVTGADNERDNTGWLWDESKEWITHEAHWVENDGVSGPNIDPTRSTWIRSWVTITGGRGKGQSRMVIDFDEDTLTVYPAWDTIPDKSSIYHVSSILLLHTDWLDVGHVDSVIKFTPNGKVLAGDANRGIKLMADLLVKKQSDIVVDHASEDAIQCYACWTDNEWANGFVYIDWGGGKGQLRRVLSNTSNTLIVYDLEYDEENDQFYELGMPLDPNHLPNYDLDSKVTVYAIDDFGTADASGSTATTIKQSDSNWANDEWKGGFVEITAGTLAGEVRQISGNTAEVITVTRPWKEEVNGLRTGGNTNSLSDNTKHWTTGEWVGAHVKIDSGAGAPQDKIVASNDENSITIYGGWDSPLNATSHYVLGLYPDDTSVFKLTNRDAYRAMFIENDGAEELGTPSATTAQNKLVDSTKNFLPDQWENGVVLIYHQTEEVEWAVEWAKVNTRLDASTLVLDHNLHFAPSPTDKYVLIKPSMYWEVIWDPFYEIWYFPPAATTVWEILMEKTDLRWYKQWAVEVAPDTWTYDVAKKGDCLVTKCQQTFQLVWGTDPTTGGPGFLERMAIVKALSVEDVIPVPDLMGYTGGLSYPNEWYWTRSLPAPYSGFYPFENPDTGFVPTDADNYLPCMANMLIVNTKVGQQDVIVGAVPYPHGPKSGGIDIFQDDLVKCLDGIMQVDFVDDWNGYHVEQGGVHCGTAEKRAIPTNDWWENW
jgi:hypothetical protein